MAFNFKHLNAAALSNADRKPGHSDMLLICPIGNFLSIKVPVGPFTLPGDTKKIATAHTFADDNGFIEIQCKAKSIEGTGEATGEPGGQVPNYKYKVIIRGESARVTEFVENLMNEDIIALLNSPQCGVDSYVQVGSACSPAQLSGFATRSGSKGAGGFKEVEFTIESGDKFYYSGAVTKQVEV